MLKSLSYRSLLPDVFDLSSLAQALEEVVIPQVGRLAVATFKAFVLSSLSKALDEDIAANAARLSVAVSDAFDLTPLSLALEDIIATEITRPPIMVDTDVFDLSSLSRALDECVPTSAQLQVKVKHEFTNFNHYPRMMRSTQETRGIVNTVHGNVISAVTSSTISTRMTEKWGAVDSLAKANAKPVPTSEAANPAALAASVIVKHELPNMNYHLHTTRTAPATTEFVNKVHNSIAASVISSTISKRKAEKSRVVDTQAEAVNAKPMPTTEGAKLATSLRLHRIDMTNLASSSKVVVEDLKSRTGIFRCSGIFSKSSKRTQAPSAIDKSNISHIPPKNKSIPSRKSSINKPFHIIPPTSSFNILTSTTSLIVSKKRKYDVMVGTSDALVPNKKCKYSHVHTITLPNRKRKLSDAFESYETGRPATKHKTDFVREPTMVPEIVPTFPPVNQRSESKLVSKSSQLKPLPSINQRGESELISEFTPTKALLPLNQRNESQQSKQILQISHTKSVSTKKRSHDDAFESTEIIVTKDPRKRRREVDARPSNTITSTTTSTQYKHNEEPSVTLPQATMITSRGIEQPKSGKSKREDETFQACCNEGDALIFRKELEAQANNPALHQLEDNCRTITSLPVRKHIRHAGDVITDGQVENNVSVNGFIAERYTVTVGESLRENLASTNVEKEYSAEGDGDQTEETVVEEGSIDGEGAEGGEHEDENENEDEEEEEARQARYLQLCREIFGDGEDSDEDY